MSKLRWCLVVTAAAAVAGCGKDDKGDRDEVSSRFQESRAEVARVMASKLANEAYARWAMKPSNQGKCPTTSDLAKYVAQEPDFKDPWGRPYVVRCGADLPAGARGAAVLSLGPDGKPDTTDDLRSWE
jgi:hypothetical protein